jgi:putative hydrolase of the HAD superfamily
MNIRHVFFDLDKTLWNHTVNLASALSQLYQLFGDEMPGVSLKQFAETFVTINETLWQRFSQGLVTGPHLRFLRFRLCLEQLGIPSNNLARRMSRAFLDIAPRGKVLEEGAAETLERLASTRRLHLITNGFEDSQISKLKASGIYSLFTTITTSDRCGYRKPDPGIFRYALRRAQASASESAYVGDDWRIDVEPAMALGFTVVWYNPSGLPPPVEGACSFYSISSLHELPAILGD